MSGWWTSKDFQEYLTGMKSLLGYGSATFGHFLVTTCHKIAYLFTSNLDSENIIMTDGVRLMLVMHFNV